jgi:hypothetical protein
MAVDNVLSLTRFVVENNMLDKLGPPFAFTVWVSARLLLVHGSTIAHKVSPDIFFFVDVLARMGKYWKVAERYSTILQRVLDEYAEYEQAAGTETERVTPSSVKILADMRRCAFDLDFLISRQPRENSATHPINRPSSRNLAPNELEYLDVFGFFNVPRVPTVPMQMGANLEINDNPMSIPGLTGRTSSTRPASDCNTNEFNITNYMIPTPETDWLFRPPG